MDYSHPDRFESEHRAYHADNSPDVDTDCIECGRHPQRESDEYCSDRCKVLAVRQKHFADLNEETLDECNEAETAIANLCNYSMTPLQALADRIIAEGTDMPVPTITLQQAWEALCDWATLLDGGEGL